MISQSDLQVKFSARTSVLAAIAGIMALVGLPILRRSAFGPTQPMAAVPHKVYPPMPAGWKSLFSVTRHPTLRARRRNRWRVSACGPTQPGAEGRAA